jgi:hypothetical protein
MGSYVFACVPAHVSARTCQVCAYILVVWRRSAGCGVWGCGAAGVKQQQGSKGRNTWMSLSIMLLLWPCLRLFWHIMSWQTCSTWRCVCGYYRLAQLHVLQPSGDCRGFLAPAVAVCDAARTGLSSGPRWWFRLHVLLTVVVVLRHASSDYRGWVRCQLMCWFPGCFAFCVSPWASAPNAFVPDST